MCSWVRRSLVHSAGRRPAATGSYVSPDCRFRKPSAWGDDAVAAIVHPPYPRKLLTHIRVTNGILRADRQRVAVVRHTARYLNRITSAIIAAAIEVHRLLGSGLVESAYRKCLLIELQRAGFRCDQKRPVPLIYKGVRVTPAYEADVIVEDCVIVEVKAVEALHPIHEQQLVTYLRLADCRVGLVLNFGGATLKSGIRRVVNDFPGDTECDSVDGSQTGGLGGGAVDAGRRPA